jgi:hypothetical protein
MYSTKHLSIPAAHAQIWSSLYVGMGCVTVIALWGIVFDED